MGFLLRRGRVQAGVGGGIETGGVYVVRGTWILHCFYINSISSYGNNVFDGDPAHYQDPAHFRDACI